MTCPHRPIRILIDGLCVLCWKERADVAERVWFKAQADMAKMIPPDKVRVLVEALETAKEIIVRIGTTACGCEDTEWYGKATAWLNKYPALARLKEAQ